MRTKIIFASIILFGLVLFAMTGEPAANVDAAAELEQAKAIVKDYIAAGKETEAADAYQKLVTDFADNAKISSAVYDIAETYRNSSKFEQSLQVYKDVLKNWPGSSEAVWAQRGAAVSNIALGKMAEAQHELDKLKKDFSADTNIAEAVFNVADAYYWFKYYQKANELYQHVLDTWPDAEHAMWSQMGLAISNIADGNDTAAEAATENLTANFNDDPNLPEALFYIAGIYGWDKKYEQAKSVYQQIIQNWPDSPFAGSAEFDAAKANVFSFIDAQDEPNALTALDTLIIDFNNHPDLPAAVYDIAARHDQPTELIETIYRQVIKLFPESPYASKAQLNLSRLSIISLINSGDDTNAMAAIDTLIADFNDHPDLPMAISRIEEAYYIRILAAETWVRENYIYPVELWEKVMERFPDFFHDDPDLYYFIADCYRHLGEYEKAIQYYQKVVDNWPQNQNQFVMLSRMRIAQSNIIPFNDEAIQAAIGSLIADFSGYPALPNAIFLVGQEYYNKDNFTKALTVWERIITELPEPDSTITAHAWYFSADCYRRLGEYKMAIEYYSIVAANWPDYEYAWGALFKIGRSYEKMKKLGVISKSEADPKIKAVYEQLLEKYPNCKGTKHAQYWLGHHK